MRHHFIVSIPLAILLQNVNAALPSAYKTPPDSDSVGIKTVWDFDETRNSSYTLNTNCSSPYNHSMTTQIPNRQLTARGRVTIKQYPRSSSDKYPVDVIIVGPNSFTVSTPITTQSDLYGTSGFDCRMLGIGDWIDNVSISLGSQQTSSNLYSPNSTALVSSYPETLNNNATQDYRKQESFNVNFSSGLSVDPKGPASSFETGVGYTLTRLWGGSVETKQMKVTRTDLDGRVGNQWAYKTHVDNRGNNIDNAYDIWTSNDLDVVKSAVPDIAKSFTPSLGQRWEYPADRDQTLILDITAVTVASAGKQEWVWGVDVGPQPAVQQTQSHPIVSNKTFSLDKTHPAISGLNYYRFRFGNNGKCFAASNDTITIYGPWSYNPDGSKSQTFEYKYKIKMQDCNTAVSKQYFLQNSDYSLAGFQGPQKPIIIGESGKNYDRFYFSDNGTITTVDGDFKVDHVSGDYPIVKDRTTGIRDGLWQYLMY
ncbi:hypothetical protein [Burkholderia pseudomallei]|uniref:hypothetical protein n=1 Tax=Burkholderia pseudomallei TaxID=28450 RepID=UPI0012F4F128|nr:hypothetical protein [Burkholderia pseudomallei]